MNTLIALIVAISLLGYLALALLAAFFGLILWGVVLAAWAERRGKQGGAI